MNKAIETAHPSEASEAASAPLARIRAWANELGAYDLIDQARRDSLLEALGDAEQSGLGKSQESLLTVLLFGPSGVGKSQLLNALAGDVIAKSHHQRPTTRFPTVYAHQSVQADRLFEYGTELGDMARDPAGAGTATFVRHAYESLRHTVVIDAPDIDSYQREHRERVLRLLPMMDVVLYVVTAQTYVNDLGWQTLLKERGRRAFAFVINKWDAEGKRETGGAGTDAGADIDAHFRTLLRERAGYENPLIFRVSAEYWLNRRLHQPTTPEPPAGDQFAELERWLSSELTTSHISEIQRRRQRAAWGRVAEALSQAVPEAWADRPWPKQLADRLSELRADGQQHIKPLVIMSAAELAQQANIGQWPFSPGPFGLLLRLGGGMRSFVRTALGRGVPLRIGPLQTMLMPPPEHSAPAATTEDGHSILAPDDGADATGLTALAQTAVADAVLTLRSAGVANQWLIGRLRNGLLGFGPRLSTAVRTAIADLIERPYGPARRIAGGVVLALTEAAALVVLGIAAWRLVLGFWSANYVDGSFVANFLLLLGLIAAAGLVGLSLSFPRIEKLMAVQLETRLRQTWSGLVGELSASQAEIIEANQRLRDAGDALKEAVNAELRAIAPKTDDHDSASADVGKLFSKTP